MSGLTDLALSYAARGWSLLPTKGKKPALRSWRRYQREAASESTLRRWFARNGVTGLAVVCGPVSGGLVVRDFDTIDSYQRWAALRPDLAETLPTVETARGRHVYFQDSCTEIIDIDTGGEHEGELRGAGIVLLPPSKHPTGHVYKWLIPLPDGALPNLDPVEAGLLPGAARRTPDPELQDPPPLGDTEPMRQRGQREHRGLRRQRITEITEDMRGGAVSAGLPEKKLADILQSTQPHATGQRNRAVFELARALKGEPEVCEADPLELRSIVEAWHKFALPVINTEPFEDTWIDFLQAWPKVKYPKGTGPMDVMFERAIASEPPKVAMRYGIPQLRQLVSLCRELQRHAGDGPFYLGCRTAGRLLDVDHHRAAKWLFLLKVDRVLHESEKGGIDKNRFRASRYFYVAGDEK